MRAKWEAFLSQGDNLALGRPVVFTHSPDYRLTKGESDPDDLTDGKLSSRVDDRIWFNQDACAWPAQPSPIAFYLDLERNESIGKVGIRLLGGREQDSLEFPGEIEVIASEDGRHFFSVASRSKLLPSEKAEADGVERYFLEEAGKAYVYPFRFDVNVRARYIGFRIHSNTMVASDELAVLGSGNEAPLVSSLKLPSVPLVTEGLAVFPRKEEMVITTGILTPNWLLLQDSRPAAAREEPYEVAIDLPEELEIIDSPERGLERRPHHKGTVRYLISHRDRPLGPYFLRVRPGGQSGGQSEIRMSVVANGFPSNEQKVAYRLVEVPAVPRLRELHVSLAWMTEEASLGWPDFFENFGNLGFNAVSFFPRYYSAPDQPPNEKTQKALALLKETRERGFKVVYNESPFHALEKRAQAGAPEALNHEGSRLSPIYRGPLYKDELQRVADLFAVVKPDYVFHDIELFYRTFRESKSDPAVHEARRRSGKTWDDFATDLGQELLADLKQAILRRAQSDQVPIPLIGQYNLDAAKGVYELIFDWKKSYPSGVDFASPSLYLRGNAPRIHQNIRENYRLIGEKRIIPWLTAGTYGEFAPHLIEPMIYEVFLNGGSGITYYRYQDFDPEDFYHHAKALKTLAPYEGLIASGQPSPVEGSSAAVLGSSVRNGKELLLLLGNYHGAKGEETTVLLPSYQRAAVMRIAGNGEVLPGKPEEGWTFRLPARGFGLFHLSQK